MEYATFNDAARAAVRLSQYHADDYWVVFDDGAYHAASDFALETWFSGCTTLGYAGYGLGFEPL
jgi:hypothetical protein